MSAASPFIPPPASAASTAGGTVRDATQRRQGRAMVDLARRRLRERAIYRWACRLSWATVSIFVSVALVGRVWGSGPRATAWVTDSVAVTTAWLFGTAIAWTAAGPLLLEDRRDGIDTLAASRGLSTASFKASQALAAIIEIAWGIGVCTLVAGALSAIISASPSMILWHLAAITASLSFATATGVVVALVATWAGRIAQGRGRTLTGTLFIGWWIVAAFFGEPRVSIIGALGAFLDTTTDLVRGIG